MFKQNQNFFLAFLAGFSFLVGHVSSASLEVIQSDNEDYGSHFSPVQATFTGKVKFEPRYTRVHDIGCVEQPCQKSQKYWSLGHRC